MSASWELSVCLVSPCTSTNTLYLVNQESALAIHNFYNVIHPPLLHQREKIGYTVANRGRAPLHKPLELLNTSMCETSKSRMCSCLLLSKNWFTRLKNSHATIDRIAILYTSGNGILFIFHSSLLLKKTVKTWNPPELSNTINQRFWRTELITGSWKT